MKKYSGSVFSVLLFLLISGCQMGKPLGNFFTPSDPVLTTSVQHALYRSDDPVIANVRAESLDGTVFLTGYVKKIHQSDEAEAIARSVRGVKTVDNQIIVRQ